MIEKEYINLSSEFSQALVSLRAMNGEQIAFIEGYIAGVQGAKKKVEKNRKKDWKKEDEKSMDR